MTHFTSLPPFFYIYLDFMAIQIPHDDNDNQKATYLVDNSGFEKVKIITR